MVLPQTYGSEVTLLEEGSLERTISTELPLHRFALGLGLTSASCQTDNTAQSEVGTSTTLMVNARATTVT
jgi:hypothetical protein